MNFVRTLASVGLATILGFSNVANAGIFKPVKWEVDFISLEGRLNFLGKYEGKDYFKGADLGDEIGIFRGNICIGSSEFIDKNQSHYFDLKIYNGSKEFILNGIYNIKAFNGETNTLWNARIMGHRANSIDLVANENLGYVPEPSSIALLGLGSYILIRKKK